MNKNYIILGLVFLFCIGLASATLTLEESQLTTGTKLRNINNVGRGLFSI